MSPSALCSGSASIEDNLRESLWIFQPVNFRPFREPGCPHGFILLTYTDRIVHFCCSDQNRKKIVVFFYLRLFAEK